MLEHIMGEFVEIRFTDGKSKPYTVKGFEARGQELTWLKAENSKGSSVWVNVKHILSITVLEVL